MPISTCASACVGVPGALRAAGRLDARFQGDYRLWRNRPDIRFEGQIHETVVPSIRAATADAYALQIEPFDRITINHFGYEGDRADKRARDEPLLLAELARHPDRPFVIDHLARVYEAAGDGQRAVDTWKRGMPRRFARATARSRRTWSSTTSTPSSTTCFPRTA